MDWLLDCCVPTDYSSPWLSIWRLILNDYKGGRKGDRERWRESEREMKRMRERE